MERLIKYIGYSLFLPIWWLQLLVPRNRNIWVFGAWYGRRYSDNGKYLFEHIISRDENILAVWITKSPLVYNHVNSIGNKCYMANSLLGIYYCLRAKYVIVSSGKLDVNYLFVNGSDLIQLWHGNPMKKIGLDDKYSPVNSFFQQKIVPVLFPFICEFNYDFVVSNASVFTDKMASAFGVPKDRILETGCPRNDIFYSKTPAKINIQIRGKFKDCKLVYYLPTFRSKGQKQNLLELENYNQDRLQKFLMDENLVFITKAHFATIPLQGRETGSNRIYHLPDEDLVDINFLLKDADILITDYSGAYFDFLLTEKPIIFAAFDLEDYLSSSREMYFDYYDVVAGPIVYTWDELYQALSYIWDKPEYRTLVKEKNQIFNKFHDDRNSERVYEAIVN